ncbi:9456_t:CDS:1, partial [Acaulospora morrowiae]
MTENIDPRKPSFPPSITVDKIVKIHLKKGLINVNKTLNSFLIYRMVYIHEAPKNSKNNPLLASKSWRDEPEDVKKFYKELADNVKA